MIVKVVPSDPTALVQASYFDAGRADISTGVRWYDEAPESRKSYTDICDAFYVHVVAVEETPAKTRHGEAGSDQWQIRFAYWYDGNEGRIHMVVTSGDIYLMSDRGDTVDRV